MRSSRRHVVSFSGGRTSAYAAYVLKVLLDDPVFVFMDTGAEHPKTYEFIRKVDESFGLKLVCLRGDFDQPLGSPSKYTVVSSDMIGCDLVPFSSMMRKYGTPTVNSPWCTSRMKQEIHDKWCNDMFGKGGYVTWLGIRADEPKRLGRMGKQDDIRFLAEVSDFSKEDILAWWAKQPFDLDLPEHKGNCVFCIKKSIAKLTKVCAEEPGLLEQFKQAVSQANDRHDMNKPYPKEVMYRGRNSLDSLKALGGVASSEYIDRMSQGRYACEESCEVFQEEFDAEF